MCHNDVEPKNVVFRDGVAVALLDFEFAAPGRAVYDVAQLARLCVPIDDDVDQARLGWRPAERPARLRLVADAYGLDRDGRAELLTAMDDAIDPIETVIRRRVDAGDPNSIAMSTRTGSIEKSDRRRRWSTDHHDQFAGLPCSDAHARRRQSRDAQGGVHHGAVRGDLSARRGRRPCPNRRRRTMYSRLSGAQQ